MHRKLLTIFILICSSNVCADLNKDRVKQFLDTYFTAVKDENFKLLRTLSISAGTCQYKGVRRVLDDVGIAEYSLELKPFSKESDDYKFAVALNNGKPVVLGEPTHMAKTVWIYTKENFTKGHKCHAVIESSASISLAISDRGKIREHSYCEQRDKSTDTKKVHVTGIQMDEIKSYIDQQKPYSRLKARLFIMKKYDYKSTEAKQVLERVCEAL